MYECPPAQCCDFEECEAGGPNECPEGAGRDHLVPLCGACLPGKSETLFSGQCEECEGTNWLLLGFFSVVLLGLGWYLHYSAKTYATLSQTPVSQIVITKCLAYFYQSVPVVLDTDSVTPILQPLLTFFSLRPSNGNSGGKCVFANLDAMGKLLIPLIGYMAFLLILLTILLLLKIRERIDSKSTAGSEGELLGLLFTSLVGMNCFAMWCR